MKKLAILAVATTATATALAAPANSEARTGAASAEGSVRYAWVKSCPKKDYTVPCGTWTLSLSGGKQFPVTDTQVHPVTSKGKVDKEAVTAFAVSGNGQTIAYFRTSDKKLVARDLSTNATHVLPGKSAKLPKGIGMGDLDTFLSADGNVIVIDYFDQDSKLPSLIVNVKTGKIQKLNGDATVQGFSPDGDKLLATRYTDENTTQFVVYDENGNKGASQIVPQIVANNAPLALADDGTTVAVIITAPSGKQRLRVYDLASDTVGDSVNVNVPKNESAHRLFWNSSDNLTLWELRNDAQGNTIGATARNVDPSSGAISKIDSFKIKTKLWTWLLPGE